MIRTTAIGFLVCGTLLACASVVQADLPPDGLYRLSNHPDGEENPPPYGLRLDGLDGQVVHPRTRYTFDFNYDDGSRQAAMFMDLNVAANTIHIYGSLYGGLNQASDPNAPLILDVYDNPLNGRVGWWNVDFTYAAGVDTVGTDGFGVTDVVAGPDQSADHSNNRGTLTADPTADAPLDALRPSYDFVDYVGTNSSSFRFGDDDSAPGHRGFTGLSGWGWLNHSGWGTGPNYTHVAPSDWLFTAEAIVPAPGAFVLGAFGLGLIGWFRRRSA